MWEEALEYEYSTDEGDFDVDKDHVYLVFYKSDDIFVGDEIFSISPERFTYFNIMNDLKIENSEIVKELAKKYNKPITYYVINTSSF